MAASSTIERLSPGSRYPCETACQAWPKHSMHSAACTHFGRGAFLAGKSACISPLGASAIAIGVIAAARSRRGGCGRSE